jgi:serine/threonine protein kinase/Tol biopolymer transport system component
MRIEAGQRLAHYEVVEPLGRGGMGEVWRATDTRLGREVALKILPEEFTRDVERLQRFDREARLLASLDHPDIAAIYGMEEAGSERFLVMQIAAGEDLSARLARGPLAVEEALEIARQITAALEAAHEKGIIHRDLKPGNIKVDSDGRVKVLDFGLARALGEPETEQELANSPTMVRPVTSAGMILGTAAYMSPEQARGKKVDRRSDLWSFGVVLWEMLTGSSPFGGATVSDTIASVLRSELDWSALPAETPPSARRLLRRCLQRDVHSRLSDATTVRLDLEEALEELRHPPIGSATHRPKRPAYWMLAAAAAVLSGFAALAGALLTGSAAPETSPPFRFELSGISFNTVSAVAISPDGRTVAYVPYDPTARGKLHLRSLEEFTGRPIEGTEGAVNPFFSPDGQSIGYFTNDALFVVRRAGAAPARIAGVAAQGESGFWGEDGNIYFSGANIDGRRIRGITRVPASGGTPEEVSTPVEGEIGHRHPHIAGKWLLFSFERVAGFQSAAISLTDGTRRELSNSGASPVYFPPTGHLLVYQPGTLAVMAAPFDLEKGELLAAPVNVLGNVFRLERGGAAFAVARNGTLIYTPSDTGAARTGAYGIVWVDRQGRVTPAIERRDSWTQPRISPDGRTLVVRQTIVPDCVLWSVDLDRSLLTRLTFGRDHHAPSWHPSGNRILAASSSDTNTRRVLEQWVDGTEKERPLSPPDQEADTPVWSPDGRWIAWVASSQETGSDIRLTNVETGETTAFTEQPLDETTPQFSPDGNWLAYTSNETGVPEIYVRSLTGVARRLQVSREGGVGPVWSRDGTEIFYGSRGRLMVVGVSGAEQLALSVPRELFTGNFVWERPGNFDVAPDGQRFIMIERSTADSDTEQLRVATNWSEDLKRLSPMPPAR